MKRQPKKAIKPLPRFRSENEEREFWATHDSTDYFDLRVLANQRDVPYQSLLKVYLAERVAEERGGKARRRQRARA